MKVHQAADVDVGDAIAVGETERLVADVVAHSLEPTARERVGAGVHQRDLPRLGDLVVDLLDLSVELAEDHAQQAAVAGGREEMIVLFAGGVGIRGGRGAVIVINGGPGKGFVFVSVTCVPQDQLACSILMLLILMHPPIMLLAGGVRPGERVGTAGAVAFIR